MMAALLPITTTTPMFMPGQLNTKASSSPLFLAVQVVGAGAPHADAILAPSTPTRCSTLGSNVKGGNNHPAIACPPRGNTKGVVVLPLEPSLFKSLHPYVPLKFNMLPPTTCSMQCCHDSTSAWELALKHAMSSSSSPIPSLLASVDFSPTAPVSVIPVGIDISSPIESRMIDGAADELFTDVGGLSLFLELGLDFAESNCRKTFERHMGYELADSVLIHIGDQSLLLEQYLDVGQELEKEIDNYTCLCHVLSGVELVFRVVPSMEGKLQQLHSREMLHGRDIVTLLLPWDPGVWIIFAEETNINTAQKSDIDGQSSWLRRISNKKLQDNLHNTKLFNQEVGMSVYPDGKVVIKLESGQRENYSQCIHKFGGTLLGVIRNFDVLLDPASLWPTKVKMEKYDT